MASARPNARLLIRLVGGNLGNGNDAYPDVDEAQTVYPWTPPELSHPRETITAIDPGSGYMIYPTSGREEYGPGTGIGRMP